MALAGGVDSELRVRSRRLRPGAGDIGINPGLGVLDPNLKQLRIA